MKYFFDRLKINIESHDRVILMTHQIPDLDGLGSAIVLSEVIKKMGKECFIVAPKKLINKTLNKAIRYLNDNGVVIPFKYEKSMEYGNDLLIILDVSEERLIECSDVLYIKDRFIIDHHSRCDDLIDGNIYLNDGISSTVEIICEFMKYLDIDVDKIFYSVLYAGLYQDTNGFVLKTLPRTFEIASYLLNSGADIMLSYDFLKESKDSIIGRYDYIRNCEEIYDGIYLCILDRQCSSITVAKAADEMLKFEEAKASIAIGKCNDSVLVSARSFENVDVCTWMVKLGGGGHYGAAAAKVDGDISEVVDRLKKIVGGRN